MEHVEFLGHVVDFQARMLKDAEDALVRVKGKYEKIDNHRLMVDDQVAAAEGNVTQAKQDLEDARTEHLAAQDQHGAALADPSEGEA